MSAFLAKFRRQAAIVLGAALSVMSIVAVSAADYSTQITTAAGTLVSDITPALAAAVVVALSVMALFIAAHLALRAFHLVRGG